MKNIENIFRYNFELHLQIVKQLRRLVPKSYERF